MLKRLKNLAKILTICLTMSVLSGCVNVPVSEYCIIDFQIKPTPDEIDRALDANLKPLLLRIDEHDTMYAELGCTNE